MLHYIARNVVMDNYLLSSGKESIFHEQNDKMTNFNDVPMSSFPIHVISVFRSEAKIQKEATDYHPSTVRTRSSRVEFKGLLRRLGPNSSALNIYRVIP